ncbi:MAG TPA: trypsin-like peptidase domain-containing protein [Actinospica sp.]|nr:trypsin-like peptidase domain-containing protein [Actinospica sp.]
MSLKSLLSAAFLAQLLAVGVFAAAAAAAPPARADDDPGRAPNLPAPPSLLSAGRPSAPQAARGFAGMPQFGELVWQNPDGSPGAKLCSAVTVQSAGGDLIATAAHCVGGVSSRIGGSMTVAYLPGAADGSTPYGVWYPTRIIRPRQWMNKAKNPDFDIAFLTVSQPGESRSLESITGAERFGALPADGTLGVQIGYPYADSGPVACRTAIHFRSRTQLRLDCANFPSGTSGGPVLTHVDPVDGIGTLVGVIGGYQSGGAHSYVSYASAFTPAIRRLYLQASQY